MEELRKELINYGYESGNNCYYIITNDFIVYFNNDCENNFTNVTVEYRKNGGQEEELFDIADYYALKLLVNYDYNINEIM